MESDDPTQGKQAHLFPHIYTHALTQMSIERPLGVRCSGPKANCPMRLKHGSICVFTLPFACVCAGWSGWSRGNLNSLRQAMLMCLRPIQPWEEKRRCICVCISASITNSSSPLETDPILNTQLIFAVCVVLQVLIWEYINLAVCLRSSTKHETQKNRYMFEYNTEYNYRKMNSLHSISWLICKTCVFLIPDT